MTVLVTGATGTVGREVVRLLSDAGADVRAGTREPSRADGLPSGVEAVRADVLDPAGSAAALHGVDAVFLLRPPQVTRPAAMAPFVDAVAAAGVRAVVLLSVQGAGANPLLPHRGVERLLERTDLGWTFLRPGYFHQNLLEVHREEVRDRDELFVPAGAGRTALVDARDVAAVAARALTEPGHARRAYELTSQALTWSEVAEALSAARGRRVAYPRPGVLRYAVAELRRGRPAPLVLVTAGLYSATRLGLSGRTTGDLAALLERSPLTLADFTEDHADAWR